MKVSPLIPSQKETEIIYTAGIYYDPNFQKKKLKILARRIMELELKMDFAKELSKQNGGTDDRTRF